MHKDNIWNAIRTYINYFGINSTITRQGLLLFLSDILDLSSEEVFATLDEIKRKLIKKGFITKVSSGQFFIVKEIPLNMEVGDFEKLVEMSN